VALAHGGGAAIPVAAGSAAGWWLLVTVVLIGGAAMLRSPAGDRVDVYGVPNGLTALRAYGCLPLMLVATLSLPGRLALVLWGAAGGIVGLLDAADGAIARRWGPITALGKALDPFMDAVYFVVAATGSLLLGIMPAWLMALVVFRYAGPVLATPVVLLSGRRPELVFTAWGRRNTELTGVVLFTLLWVRIAGGPIDVAALAVALPTLVPTMILHFIALGRRAAAAPRAPRRARQWT